MNDQNDQAKEVATSEEPLTPKQLAVRINMMIDDIQVERDKLLAMANMKEGAIQAYSSVIEELEKMIGPVDSSPITEPGG